MIDDVLVMLREKLNSYFKFKTAISEDMVNFIDGGKLDPISFTINSVTPLLINMEEDKTLRQPDRYEGPGKKGLKAHVNPRICINLLVLFVCSFTDYKQSLKSLSLIMKFFQRNQVLDRFNTPDLHDEIDKLKIELVTLPVSQQNEIWSSLRTTYKPSVLYKISMLVFHDNESVEIANDIVKIETKINLTLQ